jgi:anti-sigma regulatory factor (Ser/Thr protein kinase)
VIGSHSQISREIGDEQREREGTRAGGYGLLLAGATVDELIYSEIGNEVLLIKYVDSPSDENTP